MPRTGKRPGCIPMNTVAVAQLANMQQPRMLGGLAHTCIYLRINLGNVNEYKSSSPATYVNMPVGCRAAEPSKVLPTTTYCICECLTRKQPPGSLLGTRPRLPAALRPPQSSQQHRALPP